MYLTNCRYIISYIKILIATKKSFLENEVYHEQQNSVPKYPALPVKQIGGREKNVVVTKESQEH